MGNFSKVIRKLTIKPVGLQIVSLNGIKAQYNPYRFKYWQSLHEGPPEKVLDIAYSPHVRLLEDYEDDLGDIAKTAYYQMQKKYGRGHRWISEKIRGFLKLYDAISTSLPLKGDLRISVIQQPIRNNPYNSGYEVFEGHHRIACLCQLGMNKIPVTVLKVIK